MFVELTVYQGASNEVQAFNRNQIVKIEPDTVNGSPGTKIWITATWTVQVTETYSSVLYSLNA